MVTFAKEGQTLLVSSASREYPRVMALVATGACRIVGDRYDEEGFRVVAVVDAHARTPNARVSWAMDPAFLAGQLKDYRDWPEKWWREAIQNAVDSGAKNVQCFVVERPDGNIDAICDDDGGGMDEDVLMKKFLSLGGTTKTTGETTGGFGMAKGLLLLPWIGYRIETRTMAVEGAGAEHDEAPSPIPERRGTRLIVTMSHDRHTTADMALAYLGKCNIPGVRFTVNGQPAEARLRPGKQIREFGDKAILYKSKAVFEGLLAVRVGGMFMFSMRIPYEVKDTLCLELQKPSTVLLTTNRDTFQDRELQDAVENFLSELSADVHSALEVKKKHTIHVYRGGGKFEAKNVDIAGKLAGKLAGSVVGLRAGKDVTLSAELARSLGSLAGSMGSRPHGPLEMRIDAEVVETMMTGLKLRGPAHAEAAAKQLSWEPDFIVTNEIDYFSIPKRFTPEGMTPTIVKLARFWAELCRFVLIQVGSQEEYGVGFIFADSKQAAYQKREGEHWLVLDPFKGAGGSGEMFSLSNEDDVSALYATAIHEVTHMADHVDHHSESFATAFTKNVARCAGKDRQVRKIRKSVVARAPRREEATAVSETPVGEIESAISAQEFILLKDASAPNGLTRELGERVLLAFRRPIATYPARADCVLRDRQDGQRHRVAQAYGSEGRGVRADRPRLGAVHGGASAAQGALPVHPGRQRRRELERALQDLSLGQEPRRPPSERRSGDGSDVRLLGRERREVARLAQGLWVHHLAW